MNRLCFLPALALALALALFPLASAQAQVLLLNPGSTSGSGALAGTNPYTTTAGAIWNHGATTYPDPLKYANNTNATGVSVIVDGATITGTTALGSATISFASPTTGTGHSGSAGGELFLSSLAAKGAVYDGTSVGLVVMRVHGLALHTPYDIYITAAYVGDTSGSRPGGSANPASMAVFTFAAPLVDTLSYASNNALMDSSGIGGSGGGSLTAGTVVVSEYKVTTNVENATWTENNNFVKFQITLTEENPTLYIASVGDRRLDKGGSSEQRGWLNGIQIVTVPEPGTSAALACALALLALRRQRKRRRDSPASAFTVTPRR
jgi:hypothetical protein